MGFLDAPRRAGARERASDPGCDLADVAHLAYSAGRFCASCLDAGRSAVGIRLSRVAPGARLQTPPEHYGLNGLEDDEQVQPDGHVLDVEEIVLKLLEGVLDARPVRRI